LQSQIINEFTKTYPKIKINQGDILKDISLIVQTDFVEGSAVISEITLEYAVVINQECDLDVDFNTRVNGSTNQDKYLPNILLLPAYLSSKFREGSHRGESLKGMVWNSDQWRTVRQNNNARLHVIQPNEDFQIPELIIDFKHLYSINRDVLYKSINEKYLASICEIYRESLSQRYAFYLSRIGIPERT